MKSRAAIVGCRNCTTGGWFGPEATVIVMVRVSVPVAPCESVAVSVIVCVPTDRLDLENDVPVPICPSMLLVHTSDAPDNAPSSGSFADPLNDTAAPCANEALFVGAEISAVGGWFGALLPVVTLEVFEFEPFGSVMVSVTEYVPATAYVWLAVFPLPVVPSPNAQPNDGDGHADVEALALNEQVSCGQLAVKLATGSGGGETNPVYSSRFGVFAGSDVMSPDVAFDVRAVATCAGVAVGFVCR